MPCYHPLEAWRGPVLPSGKRSVVFKRGESTPALCLFPQMLPCGQCIGCRLDYSLDWADRCLKEGQMHKENCFITLTYDNRHLPKDGSLQLLDWKLFMKRLRKEVGKVRYYHAGEYGDRSGRPHDHALLFGWRPKDVRAYKRTSSGSLVYISDHLQSLWNKGYCSVGDLTFESAAYVARYCMKKVTGKGRDDIDERGLTHYERVDERNGLVSVVRPEYVTMSRNGGIGRSWFEKYVCDVYPQGCVVSRGGVKMSPPRYYDGLYELMDPEGMKRLKLARMARSLRREVVWSDRLGKYQVLPVNRSDRLLVMEEVKERQLSVCRRTLESGQ